MLKIKGIRRIYKSFLLFLINKLFVGTAFYSVKRKLMCKLGYKVGNGTRIVGPIFCTAKLEIGENCWIGRNFSVNGNGKLIIENNCDIAPNVSFLTGGHKIGCDERRAGEGENYEIHIGKGCWIGANATILGNTTIGDYTVIAACGCVTGDLEANGLYGGVPAKRIKELIPMALEDVIK